MPADFPNEGFALGFSPDAKEVYLDGKSGYPSVGTSWRQGAALRGANITGEAPILEGYVDPE